MSRILRAAAVGTAAGVIAGLTVFLGLAAMSAARAEYVIPAAEQACLLCYGAPTPYPTYTPYPTLTPAVVWLLVTPTPLPTATPTPTPTLSPTPTPTPLPTATPAPLKDVPGDGWIVFLPEGVKAGEKPAEGIFAAALLYWQGADWQVGVLPGRPPSRVGGVWWHESFSEAGRWSVHTGTTTWAAQERDGHYLLIAAGSGLTTQDIWAALTWFGPEG